LKLLSRIMKKNEEKMNRLMIEEGYQAFKGLVFDKNGIKIPSKAKKTATSNSKSRYKKGPNKEMSN